MTKILFRFTAFLLTAITFGCLAGCNKEDTASTPAIEIKNIKSTSSSISFTLIPQDATAYGYACVTIDDYKANNFTLTRVDNGDKKDYMINDLSPATAYMIVAESYNGRNTSERKAMKTFLITDVPTIEVVDILPTSDGISFTLKASEGSTSVYYAVYTEAEAKQHENDDPEAPGYKDWRVWKNEAVKSGGNQITLKLDAGDYIVEAYAMAKTTPGNHVKESFGVIVQDRPAVKYTQISLNSEDAVIKLTRNDLAPKYYVGLMNDKDYTIEKVLAIVQGAGAEKRLHSEDYEGSLKKLVGEEEFNSIWTTDAEVLLWIVPVGADGSLPTPSGGVDQGRIKVPARTYGGKGVVKATVDEIAFTTFNLSVTATDCIEYYMTSGLRESIEQQYSSDKDIVEKLLFTKERQTAAEQPYVATGLQPGSEYGFYAVGIDTNGKIGNLTKSYIKTKEVAFESQATVSVSSDAAISDATLTFTPENGCTSVRYLVLTNTDYATLFGGFTQVKNALALQTASGIQTLSLSGTTQVKLTNLVTDQLYLVFSLPLDQDNKLGQMQKEISFRTKSYDLTASVSVTTTTPVVVPSTASTSRVTFTATPSAGCKAYYIQLIPKDKTYSDNDLVQKLLNDVSDGKTTAVIGRGTSDAKPYNYDNKISNTSDCYLYILCKDADGKYNNPNATRTEVKIKP